MAAKQAQKTGGVISIRSTQLFITPPGPLGFNALITPEDPFGDGLKFKVNHHYTEEAAERLMGMMDTHVVDDNWDQFLKAAKDAGKDPPGGEWIKPLCRDWVQDHLKQPKEGSRQQLPFIAYSNEATFRNKDGETIQKTMRAYDAKGKLLDMASLKMGYGSIVQVVVMPGLFISGLIKQPQPSLKLQGVRVLKLEQYGAGGPSLGEVSEEDMEMLGEDVQADDLSAYTGEAKPGKPQSAAVNRELDDDLPF